MPKVVHKEVHRVQAVEKVDFAALSNDFLPLTTNSCNSLCNAQLLSVQAANANSSTQEADDAPHDVVGLHGRGGASLGNFRIVEIPSIRWIIDALREGQRVTVREASYVAEKIS